MKMRLIVYITVVLSSILNNPSRGDDAILNTIAAEMDKTLKNYEKISYVYTKIQPNPVSGKKVAYKKLGVYVSDHNREILEYINKDDIEQGPSELHVLLYYDGQNTYAYNAGMNNFDKKAGHNLKFFMVENIVSNFYRSISGEYIPDLIKPMSGKEVRLINRDSAKGLCTVKVICGSLSYLITVDKNKGYLPESVKTLVLDASTNEWKDKYHLSVITWSEVKEGVFFPKQGMIRFANSPEDAPVNVNILQVKLNPSTLDKIFDEVSFPKGMSYVDYTDNGQTKIVNEQPSKGYGSRINYFEDTISRLSIWEKSTNFSKEEFKSIFENISW